MKDESEINDSQGPFEPVAIIGMSCIFPDSENIEDFGRIYFQTYFI